MTNAGQNPGIGNVIEGTQRENSLCERGQPGVKCNGKSRRGRTEDGLLNQALDVALRTLTSTAGRMEAKL